MDLAASPRHMQHGTSQPGAVRYAEECRAATTRGARVIVMCAVTLVPAFAYLDTVLFASHAAQFVYWRFGSIAVALAVLALLGTRIGRRYPLLVGALVPITIGINVDLITLTVGRETNPYYAGLILIMLAVSLLLPWSARAAFVISTILVGSYAAGMLATGTIADVPLFTSNVLMLASAAVLVVVGAAVSERLRRREFDSRMSLDAHAKRQEAVARLGQLALAAANPGELMARATTLIAETLGYELAAVLELTDDGDTLVVRSGVGWQPGVVARTTMTCDRRSQARFTLSANAPVLTDDLDEEKRFVPMALLRQHDAVSGICVPIAGRERPFGVLVAFSATQRTCTTPEADCLESLAGVLTTAILREHADLSLATDAETSAAMARIGRELISSLETPVLLERLCEQASLALGTDHSATWLLDDAEQVYRPISAHGLTPDKWEALKALRLPITALESSVELLVDRDVLDLTPDSLEHPIVAGILKHLGIARSLLIPLRRGGRVIGVQANGYRTRLAPFTRQQLQLAGTISQVGSMALSNARLVEELERASRLKSEFVSTMSHELRTPLNVILGYLDMFAEEAGDHEHIDLLRRARAASLELLDMIEATLNLNRIAAGQDPPVVTDVRVDDLWKELGDDFAALPQRTQAVLSWEAPDELLIRSDRRKLKIVVKNLVGNALKFTAEGRVVARCRREGDACIVTVSDTGVGIPGEHLPHIFDMFRQVDSSDRRSYSGAGLGLYIVKSLLTQLGGSVDVESAPGSGSIFTVSLPVAGPALAAPAMPASEPHAAAADASAGVLHAPHTTADGRAAESRVGELAQAEERLHAVAAHVADARDVAAAAPAQPRRPRRIVFADDLEVNRHMLRRFLAREMPDVECFEASDGLQALALVEAHKPDLVILDLRMPEMDGWQAARRIRELESGRDIPILALSVTASPGVEAYALHAGCNEFVAKPVSDYGGLLQRIVHWLGPSDQADAGPPQPGDADVCVLCRQTLPNAYLRQAVYAQR